jgi:hypothetical protein
MKEERERSMSKRRKQRERAGVVRSEPSITSVPSSECLLLPDKPQSHPQVIGHGRRDSDITIRSTSVSIPS